MRPRSSLFSTGRGRRGPAEWFARLAFVVAIATPPLCAQKDRRGGDDSDVVTAPPVLVSTTGGGDAWSSIPELIAAAEAGNARACFQYAQLLEEGNGAEVAADPAQALDYYRKAAAQGDGDALFRIGKIRHDGL